MNRSSTYLLGTILSVGVAAALASGGLAPDHARAQNARGVPVFTAPSPMAGAQCTGSDPAVGYVRIIDFSQTTGANGQPLYSIKLGGDVANLGTVDHATGEVELLVRLSAWLDGEPELRFDTFTTINDLAAGEVIAFEDAGGFFDIEGLTISDLRSLNIVLYFDDIVPNNNDCNALNNGTFVDWHDIYRAVEEGYSFVLPELIPAAGAVCSGPDPVAERITVENFREYIGADGQKRFDIKFAAWVGNHRTADYLTEDVELLARLRVMIAGELLATTVSPVRRGLRVDAGYEFTAAFVDFDVVGLNADEFARLEVELALEHLKFDFNDDDISANNDCDLSNNSIFFEGLEQLGGPGSSWP